MLNRNSTLKDLKNRIMEISYDRKLSHLSSCLTTVGVLDEIYKHKHEDEPFILSNGHSFCALAVILEKYHNLDAEKLIEENGTHPKRNIENSIYCTTGSLGCGLPIA